MGEFQGLRAWHGVSQFPDHLVFPAAKELEGVSLQNLHLAIARNREHLLEIPLFVAVIGRVVELDHGAKVEQLEPRKAHGGGHALDRLRAQVELAVTHLLQVHRRREARITGKLPPRERTLHFALGVIVQYVMTVIRVFSNLFHAYKLPLFSTESKQYYNTNIADLCRIRQF